MRDSLLYEAAAYGVVPAQFTVGCRYLAARWGVVPVSPFVAMLVVAHLAAPAVFVLARTFDERVDDQLRTHYRTLEGTPAADLARSDGDDGPPPGGTGRRKRGLLLYAAGTLVFSLAGVALAYVGPL